MKYIVFIPLLLFYSSLFGQSKNRVTKKDWQRYIIKIEDSVQKLSQGEFHESDWQINKITTKKGFSWVQFEIFWTTTEGKMFGFIAEDTRELEEICLRIENFYLKNYNNNREARTKIDGIGFQPFQGEFFIDTSIKKRITQQESKRLKKLKNIKLSNIIEDGWDKGVYNTIEKKSTVDLRGVRLNKVLAAEFVQLLRKQYHFFKGFDQNRTCNNVRFSALGLFKKKNFALTAEEYELYMAMNCRKLTFQMVSQYGNSLVNLNKYNSAVNFYKAIDDNIIYCENCGNLGSFYFKSAKIKNTYLNDYEGALIDINKAISLNKTGARLWIRSLVYEKMNMLEKSKKDKQKAYYLDSLYYLKEINKNKKDLSFYKISPINAAKAAKDYRQNADYHKKIKMFSESKEDSINAMKYDTVYVKYNIDKINKKIAAYYDIKKMKRRALAPILSNNLAKRAKYYKQIGLYEKAFNDDKKILELSPENTFYTIEISKYYFRNNNFEKALEIVNETISLKEYPDFKKIQLNNLKGEILLKLYRVEDACRLYKEMSDLKMYKDMISSRFISTELKASCELLK